MKIVLVCAAGMSTSLVVQKMQKEAAARGLDAQIVAIPMEELERVIDGAAVVMLGPQVRFKLSEFQALGKQRGIPVTVMNTMDYGMVNGKKILEAALALIK